jgi:mono/diheme cytochrome c family protein
MSAAIVLVLLQNKAFAYDPRADRGYRFALSHCSGCHAIGKTGQSPLAEAPPFRTLHERYPIDDLAEAFAEGIVTGHPAMPEFRLDGDQIDNLLAYLKSL